MKKIFYLLVLILPFLGACVLNYQSTNKKEEIKPNSTIIPPVTSITATQVQAGDTRDSSAGRNESSADQKLPLVYATNTITVDPVPIEPTPAKIPAATTTDPNRRFELSDVKQCEDLASQFVSSGMVGDVNYYTDSCYSLLAKNLQKIEICSFIKNYSPKKQCYYYLKDISTSGCGVIKDQAYQTECINMTISSSTAQTETGTFIDSRDGQTYKWTKIGTQIWLAENLKYDNGCSKKEWAKRSDVGWCGYYENNQNKYAYRGLLYQWSAAMSGSTKEGAQGACPVGWHVPTDGEFDALEIYIGMDPARVHDALWIESGSVGQKLKDDSWGGSNEYGFSILPVGFRYSDGSYNFLSAGEFTNFWTSTDSIKNNSGTEIDGAAIGGAAWYRTFGEDEGIYRYADGNSAAASVRCLKDKFLLAS